MRVDEFVFSYSFSFGGLVIHNLIPVVPLSVSEQNKFYCKFLAHISPERPRLWWEASSGFRCCMSVMLGSSIVL